jgi:hypothetical protein
VNEFFKSDKIKIFKNCVNLIEEIEQYKWQTVKPGQIKNAPEHPRKYRDHACDCLRYMISSRPENPIEIKKVDYETHAKSTFDPFIPVQDEPIEIGTEFIGAVEN